MGLRPVDRRQAERVNLVGIHEIAAALGVSRQRADVIVKQKGFPKPAETLQMGRVWRLSDFEKWRAKHGR
jgi:prophage regulatory protein